jgi:hypothetical protein
MILGKPVRSYQIVGEFGGALNDSDRNQHRNWAGPLADIQPLEPPGPSRGSEGFWRWTVESAAP